MSNDTRRQNGTLTPAGIAELTALRADAEAHHDADVMALCEQALAGDAIAQAECWAIVDTDPCEQCGEPAADGSRLCVACKEEESHEHDATT